MTEQDEAVRLPIAAVHAATRWVEENITPRRCDSDGVADCWRCTTVAMARWLEAALATPPPVPAAPLDVVRRLVEVGPPPDALMDRSPQGQELRQWWLRLADVLRDARRLTDPETRA